MKKQAKFSLGYQVKEFTRNYRSVVVAIAFNEKKDRFDYLLHDYSDGYQRVFTEAELGERCVPYYEPVIEPIEPEEMTMEEVCSALGKTVKIVKA